MLIKECLNRGKNREPKVPDVQIEREAEVDKLIELMFCENKVLD